MATPRGITQRHTSFIGSACQAIHHTPVTKHTDTQTIKVQTPKHKKERYSRPLYSSHTTQPPHTTNHMTDPCKGPTGTTTCCPRHPTVHQRKNPFVTQIWCIHPPPTPRRRTPHSASHTTIQTAQPKTDRRVSTRQFQHVAVAHSATSTTHPQLWAHKQKLLRKEVIQPHLPVRLPCYDFVPIADPTFDSSL